MRRMILARLASGVLVLFGVTLLVYFLVNALPGSVAAVMLGDQATEEAVAELSAQLGLDRPVIVRYFEWMGGALTGDLGKSFTSGQPVSEAILQRIPATAQLTFMALVVAIFGSVLLSVVSLTKPRGVIDRTISTSMFVLLATPNFLLGLLLVLAVAVSWSLLPSSGWTSFADDPIDNLRRAILPTLALAAGPLAMYTRLLRGDMMEQMLRSDYVVTARAKGVSERTIRLRHVLRNSLFPLLTNIGLTVGILVGGSVVIENVFGIPGLGRYLVQSIGSRDAPVVLGVVVIIATTVVIVNLLIDILYGVLDPRVRHERSNS